MSLVLRGDFSCLACTQVMGAGELFSLCLVFVGLYQKQGVQFEDLQKKDVNKLE